MKLLPVLSIALLYSADISAQQFDPAPYGLTDRISVIPLVSANLRYDDNIYDSEFDTTSSAIFLITPSVEFVTDDGINRYAGSYNLTSGIYDHDDNDNFVDHILALSAHTEFNAKQRMDLDFSFNNLHEARGTGLTESNATVFDEVLKYNEYNLRGYYQFGGLTSMMRVGGGSEYLYKSYQNFTEYTKFNNLNELTFFVDADYQLGSVTFLTLDLSHTNIRYAHLAQGDISSDNHDSRLLFGMKWEGLGKTTGTMKVGYQYKNFDSGEREDGATNMIDFGVTWKPVEYSSFTAHLKRTAEETDTVGDYIETLGGSMGWHHNWREGINSEVQYLYSNENYIGADREDDSNGLFISLSYDVRRWVSISVGYEFTKKDSNVSNISYDKNIFNLGITGAL